MNIKQIVSRIRHVKRTKVIYPFFTFLTILFFAGVMFHTLGFLTINIGKAIDPVNTAAGDLHVGDAKLVIVLQRLNVERKGLQLNVSTSTTLLSPTSTSTIPTPTTTPEDIATTTSATTTEGATEDIATTTLP